MPTLPNQIPISSLQALSVVAENTTMQSVTDISVENYRGIHQAKLHPVPDSLPVSWLGKADAPPTPPMWANIDKLSSIQVRNLLAQVAYDASEWNYTKIGPNNELGRYQVSTQTLEDYGLLAKDSNRLYGIDCINYKHCWRSVVVRKNTNSYANYIYNVESLQGFLQSTNSQEHLAFQMLYDLYTALIQNGGITNTDTADIIAGMLYVAWTVGAGNTPTSNNANGTGAYAWRYYSIGSGENASRFNSGRQVITILSQ